MKGTIRAELPEAEKRIIENRKELFEHNTIVDLLRNDLSMVSDRVEVQRFRFISRIMTNRGELLQVSSEITGRFRGTYCGKMGDILLRMLPAGSVSGAPKERTLQIIRDVEGTPRGFYTGVFGFFNGRSLDSAVMIRFIENTGSGLRFRSGGGVTALSNAEEEYREMTDKVYVPFI
jgi:para-aminobenzoate synthetase component 1